MDEFTEFEITDERWSISDDSTADWAVGKVKETNAERDRLVSLCDAKIAFYLEQKKKAVEKAEQQNSFLLARLSEYMETVKPRETKTQLKYDLIEGSLVMTKPKTEFKKTESDVIKWLKDNNHSEFIKTEEKLEWGNFKKNLIADIENGIVTTKDGEIVEGVVPEVIEGKFDIKFKETAS